MRAGDILKFDPALHYVYALIDDKDTVFYVGRSHCPQSRLYHHWRGTGNSEVTTRVKGCWIARMLILAGPIPEREAIDEERRQIALYPQLLNQEHRPEIQGGARNNQRLPVFQQFVTRGVKVQ